MDRITSIKNQTSLPALQRPGPGAWPWRDSRNVSPPIATLYFLYIAGCGVASWPFGALGDNLQRVVENEARTLLGVPICASAGQRAFAPVIDSLFNSWGGEQSREVRVCSR